jgi:hypothetical protein
MDDCPVMRELLAQVREGMRAFQPLRLAAMPLIRTIARDLPIAPGPETFLNEWVERMEAAAAVVDGERVSKVLMRTLELVSRPDVRDWARSLVSGALEADRRRIVADGRRAACLRYFDELEQDLPGAATALLAMEHAVAEPRGRLSEWFESYYTFQMYLRADGEQKARAIKALVLCEAGHHERWLRQLAWIERLRRRAQIDPHPKYGALANELAAVLPPAIVGVTYREAVHWRNAASHPGRWRNARDFRTIELEDIGPGDRRWSETITVTELQRQLEDLSAWVAALMDACRQKAMEEMVSLLRRARGLDCLLDAVGVRKTGVSKAQFDASMQDYFRPIAQRVEVCTRRPVVAAPRP